MVVDRAGLRLPWKTLGALLLACTTSAMAHCSAAVHEGSSTSDSGAPDASAGGSPDAGGTDGMGQSVIQGVGSKCLTVCPMHLTCDPYKWKGFCTKDCMTDSDCQGTGLPPVKGVCGSDGRCYKACDPVSDPCTRQQWECVGPPGDMYCDNFYDAHYYKPETGGSSGGGDGGDGGDAAAGDATTGAD
jgi:hypothetical protein